VVRFHRTPKTAVMCHADQRWTDTLPVVLLGSRTVFKEDLRASVAELVHGGPLRVPGELQTPTTRTVEPSHLISRLRRHMQRPSPVPAARHASPATFVHKDLQDSTHVFLRQDATRRALDPPPPPFQRPARSPFTQGEDSPTLRAWQVRHRVSRQGQTCVHAGRDRTPDCHNWNHAETNTAGCGLAEHATATSRADHTLRSPRPLLGSIRHLSGHLGWGGGVKWELSHCTEQHLALLARWPDERYPRTYRHHSSAIC
jgi:hypothetical protein